ncbi:MAG TPA: chorismate-binding protein [Candidatus Baltobacteraceae bacterium]|nr:chorismate-binding protein [Candidatus Baltobacteraceae bacterium]
MDELTLAFGTQPTLLFERPHAVLRAGGAAEMQVALDRAEAALARGHWIAGYVGYDWSGALGLYDAPTRIELPDPGAAPNHAPLLASISYDAYAAAVESLKRAIYEGEVYEVNYTLPFALALTGDPFELYAYYARRSGARYQAYVADRGRALLSWSPELFLDFDGDTLQAKPMKGTAPLHAADALRNEKNRAEHVMIVDLMRNDLQRVCRRVGVERLLDVERYPTYATMTSTIAGTRRHGVSLGEVFAAAFPCGSVTGAPKRAAMRFIAAHESHARDAYCGAIGFLSPKRKGWWNVSIRTAQVDVATGLGRYDAGGAIVADSQPADEWSEIALKSSFLHRDDASFALLETFAGNVGEATLAMHLQRLERSAAAFGIEYDRERLRRAIPSGAELIRVRVRRDGSFTVNVEEVERPTAPVSVCVSDVRVCSDDPFLRHKTSWRPLHEAAAAHARARGCLDAILRNERGELTEGSRTTLFAEIDGRLWTPPLSAGLLPGILRERLVSEGRARERNLTLEDLHRSDAVYVGNSARGLLRATLDE